MERTNKGFEQENENLVYGKNAVRELLASGRGVDTVYVSETMAPAEAAYYAAAAKDAGAVVKRVHPQKLDKLCKSEHNQGVAAFAATVQYLAVDDLLAAARDRGEAPVLVLADGVEDPHNLGAIIRTALLCGAHGVVIPKRGGAQVTATVHRASAGAASRLGVARVANIGEAVRRLKQENVFVYCADMDGEEVHRHNFSGGVALVVGAEGKGVSPLVKRLCDGVVRLDMAGGTGVDSYNVSVAAGIILYEIMGQHGGRADTNGR